MTKTILIVENNEYFHDLYQTMLKESEYKIIHAYYGYKVSRQVEHRVNYLLL